MDQTPSFSKLLNTNGAPNDQETADLRVFLSREQLALDKLDKEIQVLVERRAGHAKAIEEYSALLSPVRRVSGDILLSIFEHACLKGLTHADHGESREASKNYPSHVVALSHVCQEWRHLSLGHPSLWSEISISSPDRPSLPEGKIHAATLEDFKVDLADYEKRIDRIKAKSLVHISRSNPVPLTISFSGRDPSRPTTNSPPSISNFRETIVDLLCGVSKRWKRISFAVSISQEDSPFFKLLTLTPEDFPLLEQVELNTWIDVEPSDSLTQSIGLFKAERLRSLRLIRSPRLLQYDTDVSWRSVTELDIATYTQTYQSFGPQHAIEVLRSFPQLVHCSIVINQSHFNMFPQPLSAQLEPPLLPLTHPISLPHLKSLEIRRTLPHGLASSLHLPFLQRLTLCWTEDIAKGVETSELVNWVRKFGGQLLEFTFSYDNLTECALIYTLENLPNLEILRMVGDRQGASSLMFHEDRRPAALTDSILEKLTPSSSLGSGSEMKDVPWPLCPRLRRISLWPTAIEFTENALVNLIAARRNSYVNPPRSHSSPYNTGVSRLEAAFAFFDSSRERNLEKVLQDRGVDLEDFNLGIRKRYQFALVPPPSNDFIEEECEAMRKS